jgi:hypothetical protein
LLTSWRTIAFLVLIITALNIIAYSSVYWPLIGITRFSLSCPLWP